MKTTPRFFSAHLLFLSLFFFCGAQANDTVTIIRNGGGAALMENSLVGITLGVSKGADYLELPVHMSADDQLLILRDTTLNRLTDVADLFPTRYRADGNYYVVDFSLSELRQLRLRNFSDSEKNGAALTTGIPTLQEGLTLIAKLNALSGKNTGVVIGLQDPGFYTAEGKDMSSRLLQTLELLSYGPEDKIFLQSADPDELQKISRRQQADDAKKFPLIQIIETEDIRSDEPVSYDIPSFQHEWLFTNSGLRILSSYAAAVALPSQFLETGNALMAKKINALRRYGLKIFSHPSAETMYHKQSIDEVTSPGAGDTAGQMYFDGIYLDSLSAPAASNEKAVFAPREDTETSTSPASTLPPFFSNLGLSQPQNSKQTKDATIKRQFSAPLP